MIHKTATEASNARIENGTGSRTVLIVSADREFVDMVQTSVCLKDASLRFAADQSEAVGILEHLHCDIVFLDLESLPGQELDIVSWVKARHVRTEVVVLVGINQLDVAGAALHSGASFYLVKPISSTDLTYLITRLYTRIESDNESLAMEMQALEEMMGTNRPMQKLLRLCSRIAPTSSTVLLSGESGTGKEFFARIVHKLSRRPQGQFVAMNCGAVPDSLFESEFFGHRKGAFTGADRDKPGLVEEAHMGTLFLDEVGELPPASQVKLLRFLQERTFRRIGETTPRSVNTRIIAATNRNLEKMVAEGTFREDLFFRLNVFNLVVPPLRARKETIPNLLRIFVHRQNTLLEKHVNSLSKGAEIILAEYDYPGNVRELENIIEHAMVLCESRQITELDLPDYLLPNRLLIGQSSDPGPASIQLAYDTGASSPQEIVPLVELEKLHIVKALRFFKNNYTETAARLGISRSTLWRKIREYGIEQEGQI